MAELMLELYRRVGSELSGRAFTSHLAEALGWTEDETNQVADDAVKRGFAQYVTTGPAIGFTDDGLDAIEAAVLAGSNLAERAVVMRRQAARLAMLAYVYRATTPSATSGPSTPLTRVSGRRSASGAGSGSRRRRRRWAWSVRWSGAWRRSQVGERRSEATAYRALICLKLGWQMLSGSDSSPARIGGTGSIPLSVLGQAADGHGRSAAEVGIA